MNANDLNSMARKQYLTLDQLIEKFSNKEINDRAKLERELDRLKKGLNAIIFQLIIIALVIFMLIILK